MGNPRSTLSTSMPHRASSALAATGSEQASALRSSFGFSVWISWGDTQRVVRAGGLQRRLRCLNLLTEADEEQIDIPGGDA